MTYRLTALGCLALMLPWLPAVVPAQQPGPLTLTHAGGVHAVAFSPDGKLALTSGNDNRARLWDAATGKPLAQLPHQGSVRALAFSPDGRLILTGSLDRTAQLWDAATGKPVGPPLRHENQVR